MPTCSTVVWEKTQPCLQPILHFSGIFIYALLENHFVPHSLFSNLQQLLPNLTPDWSFCIFFHSSDSHKRSFFTHITCGLTPAPVFMYAIPSWHLSFSRSISNLLLLHLLSESIQNLSHSALLGIQIYIYTYFVCTQDSSGVNYTLSFLEDYDFTEVIHTYTHIHINI